MSRIFLIGLITSALFVSIPKAVSSELEISPEKARESILSACLEEGTQDSKRRCILKAALHFEEYKKIKETSGGALVLKKCAKWAPSNSKQRFYEIIKCSSQFSGLQKKHPRPEWALAKLNIKSFRSEWVSRCSKENKVDLSQCVKNQKIGFDLFWNDYLNAKKNSDMVPITRCINEDYIYRTDFSQYIFCSRR